jgi:hypothetical protein
MSLLDRFERLVERTVEGGLRRLLPRPVHPVQIAKVAARAMEQSRAIGVRGPEAPNMYRVRLAPSDLARFAEYQATLEANTAQYLEQHARKRGLRPVGTPRVELVADPAMAVGEVQVDARFRDITPRSVQQAAPKPPSRGCLVDSSGRRFPLDPARGVARLGRAPDNDVVLEGDTVSRYHAEVRWHGSRWLVYDLASTNGTAVDGALVRGEPLPLAPGASLRLGDRELTYRPG